MKPRRAFTLIELLVVIAIIAVLAAILLPVLSSGKRKAQQTGCVNNIRQLSLASFMYATDFGSHAAYSNAFNPITLWMGSEYYGEQGKLFICPITPTPWPVPPHDVWGTAASTWVWGDGRSREDIVSNAVPGSYGLNGWLYDVAMFGANSNPQLIMNKQSLIQYPSKTPLFADAMWVDLWPMETNLPSTDLYNGSLATGMTRCTIARHGGVIAGHAPRNYDITQRLPGAINIGMAEGHVELAPLENLWNYYWHLNWIPPVPRPH